MWGQHCILNVQISQSSFRGTIAKRTAVNDCSGSVQQLSIRADVDVARTVEDKVGPAERAIRACRLVPDWDVRGDVAVHQPLEQPDRAINGITCQPPRPKIEALLDALDHRLGDGNLGDTIGACTLGVDNDPGLVVDEIVGVVSEKGIRVLPCNPCRLWVGQRDLFGGLPVSPLPFEPPPLVSSSLWAASRAARYSRTARDTSSAGGQAIG